MHHTIITGGRPKHGFTFSKAWRIQEWRSSVFRAGPVARSHDYNNKFSKKKGDAILLYAQNLLHSLYKMGELRICGRNFQLRFLVTIRRNAGQYGADRERARGWRAASGCRASLLLTFGDMPVLQHFS